MTHARIDSPKLNEVAGIASAVRGFSLIEMAVVLFVITLLIGSLLVPLATQVEQRQISDTQRMLEEIREALLGFAVGNSYLPCPDTDGDGVSNPAAPGACANVEGFLPWATLGVARGDAWGNRFRYRVTAEFTNTPVTPCVAADGRLGLCDAGNITVQTRTPAKAIQNLAVNVVAVIVSHGKNGFGATSVTGTARAAPPAANVDETTNGPPAGATFISRTQSSVSTVCNDTANAAIPFCEFDDLVVWVPSFTLFNRMVAAGRLP